MVLAIVSEYSEPDPDLFATSHGALISCQHFRDDTLVAINVQCVKSVVAMVPHYLPHFIESDHHFFLVERPGLDIVALGSSI